MKRPIQRGVRALGEAAVRALLVQRIDESDAPYWDRLAGLADAPEMGEVGADTLVGWCYWRWRQGDAEAASPAMERLAHRGLWGRATHPALIRGLWHDLMQHRDGEGPAALVLSAVGDLRDARLLQVAEALHEHVGARPSACYRNLLLHPNLGPQARAFLLEDPGVPTEALYDVVGDRAVQARGELWDLLVLHMSRVSRRGLVTLSPDLAPDLWQRLVTGLAAAGERGALDQVLAVAPEATLRTLDEPTRVTLLVSAGERARVRLQMTL